MGNWLNLTTEEQKNIFNHTSNLCGLPAFAIEKDAWVTLVLRMLFTSEIKPFIVFKGGTSLSKAYNIIERFSEDIDLVVDRTYLGFEEDYEVVNNNLLSKIRRSSTNFSAETLPQILKKQFSDYGINENLYNIEINNPTQSTDDPKIVFVNYKSVFEQSDYLNSRVLIETGARFLLEPHEEKNIKSILDQYNQNQNFTESEFLVKTVLPQKTLIEKMILLHEKFKNQETIKNDDRISRHLYDIIQISNKGYLQKAIEDKELFINIVKQRRKYIRMSSIDYENLKLNNLEFIPVGENLEIIKKDYRKMQENMIYGKSPNFKELINNLTEIKKMVNGEL